MSPAMGRRVQSSKLALCVALLVLALSPSTPTLEGRFKSLPLTTAWDSSLRDVLIPNVDVDGSSLAEAWLTIAKKYLLKSILVVEEDEPPREFRRPV
jgi:hypothetical protein